MTRSVAIIGAGFSGTLTALHLLSRPDGPRVHLIERGDVFGSGLAYGAGQGEHLLNVRAGNMSAYPDRPSHLLDWLQDQGLNPDPAGFVRRSDYGHYIQAQLRAAVLGPAAGRLELVRDEAVVLRRQGSGFQVDLTRGPSLRADAAVLALGVAAPRRPLELTDAPYVADPWASRALSDIDRDQSVVILGTGLTMIDIADALFARGHAAPIVALSRRGIAPQRHAGPPGPAFPAPPAGPLSQRLRNFRHLANEDWRQAFDGLRPHTTALWRNLGDTERRRFLRHLRPYWEAHRHRIAPSVADRFDAWIASGALTLAAGRLTGATREAVTWRERGQTVERRLEAATLINATGPESDVRQAPGALLAGLLESGLARPDPLRLGLDVTREGHLIDAHGRPQSGLFVIGPLARPALWESAAVPDLRNHAAALANHLREATAAA